MTNTLSFCANHISVVGELPDTSMHRHGAIVLILALGTSVRVQLKTGETIASRSVIIDAGVEHELLSRGDKTAIFYVEAHHSLSRYLRAHYLMDKAVVADVVPESVGVERLIRAVSTRSISEIFPRFNPHKQGPLDVRVQSVSDSIRRRGVEPVAQLAAGVGLSESRLSHLFRSEMGVSIKQYGVWVRIRQFLETLPQGAAVTDHALSVGYSDSSHLSHSFRKTVGLSPRSILKMTDEIRVLV